MKIKKIVPKDIYNARQGIRRFFLIVRLSREIHANEEQRVFLWDPDQEKNKKPFATLAPFAVHIK